MEGMESQHSERELYALTTPNEEGEQATKESKQGGWITFPFITGTLMGLSLVAGGWASNLLVYLITEFNVNSITATKIYNIVLGCNFLFPVAGAIMADSFLGSFPVVAIFAFVSLLGMIMFTLTATIQSLRPQGCAVASYDTCETPSNLQYGVLYMTLLLASLGLGGTRFTIATMGAGQFDKPDDQGTFFNWYFFSLYFASAISLTAIVYIQDNVSWGLGFGICVIANAISLVVFVLGKRFYRKVKPNGSPFTSIARVIVAAIQKRKILDTFGRQDYYFGFTEALQMEDNLPTKSFRFLNLAALKTEGDRQLNGLYARSWKLCTVEEVEDLKTLIRIIPLWSTGIFLGISIGNFSSLVTLQALTMDRYLGPHFKIPAGTFLLFNFLATVISIHIVDRFLLPTWRNLARRTLTPLQRIGIGHIINIFGLVGAALIESRRLHVVRTHQLMGQPGLGVPMSALWLVVPLGIVGIGEGFHFPGSVGLYYQEFPNSLKSTSTAMVSLLLAIGLYLSPAITGLVEQITGWLPNNINDGRLDNVYWMLAVLGVVNFGYYLICAKMFKYQNVEDNNGPLVPAP